MDEFCCRFCGLPLCKVDTSVRVRPFVSDHAVMTSVFLDLSFQCSDTQQGEPWSATTMRGHSSRRPSRCALLSRWHPLIIAVIHKGVSMHAYKRVRTHKQFIHRFVDSQWLCDCVCEGGCVFACMRVGMCACARVCVRADTVITCILYAGRGLGMCRILWSERVFLNACRGLNILLLLSLFMNYYVVCHSSFAHLLLLFLFLFFYFIFILCTVLLLCT